MSPWRAVERCNLFSSVRPAAAPRSQLESALARGGEMQPIFEAIQPFLDIVNRRDLDRPRSAEEGETIRPAACPTAPTLPSPRKAVRRVRRERLVHGESRVYPAPRHVVVESTAGSRRAARHQRGPTLRLAKPWGG